MVGTVTVPTVIDSESKLKCCLYLGEVGGDCGRRRRRSTVTPQGGELRVSHELNSVGLGQYSPEAHPLGSDLCAVCSSVGGKSNDVYSSTAPQPGRACILLELLHFMLISTSTISHWHRVKNLHTLIAVTFLTNPKHLLTDSSHVSRMPSSWHDHKQTDVLTVEHK